MYDLLIKNAHVLGRHETCDIAVKDGKITAIATHITGNSTKTLTLCDDDYLSPGWIDCHVHGFQDMDLYYDFPDEIGVKKGVTTIIDAGTTGALNVGAFYRYAQAAKTNVFCLLNISKFGIVKQDELADLNKIDAHLIQEAIATYPDFIIGIKARMSQSVVGNNNLLPLHIAKDIQKQVLLPLMVHIGSSPPTLADILSCMTKGDILTHCFNGKENGILDKKTKKIKKIATKAYDSGIIFDTGHGTDSFDFFVAEKARKENIVADTISTDIYIRNRKNGPVFDMATMLLKMRVIGYQWPEIIEKVTAKPAEVFNLKNKGQLKVGFDADFTIFKIKSGEKELIDSNGHKRTSLEDIVPVKTVIGGIIYDGS